jgi:hypothetical protein
MKWLLVVGLFRLAIENDGEVGFVVVAETHL